MQDTPLETESHGSGRQEAQQISSGTSEYSEEKPPAITPVSSNLISAEVKQKRQVDEKTYLI